MLPRKATIVHVLGTLTLERFDEKQGGGRRKLRVRMVIPPLDMTVYGLLLKEVVRR